MKRLIGQLLLWLQLHSRDAIVQTLTDRNKSLTADLLTFKEKTIPSLRNEIELERAENTMLKEKLASWRTEVQKDTAVNAARIAALHDGMIPAELNGRAEQRRYLADE